jgi:hypothetical protein
MASLASNRFLRMIIDGDQALIQKALPDFCLVSAGSISQYDLGL